ncbi:YkvI family membrane protein [Bacillus massiliigorillae]|uniref:YkvI family membrane protein n=1 Tax=Bacillus massiliigorillae TaxID=1243664 RepID=UPI00039CE5A3|nr:membrane protein [Bacillus massiliigorillae]
MKNSINLAGAYIGILVGAGFASGQEVLQFFTHFGIYSIIGVILATVLFSFLGMQIVQLGSDLQTVSHKKVIYHICGRYLGLAVDVLITFFLFGVTVVMIAGSGSIFQQQFGIPSMVGCIVMTVITIVTLLLDIKKIISIISLVTPFLLVIMVILAAYSFFTMDYSFADIQKYAKASQAAASNWVMGSLLYVSYNIAAGIAMLAVMGGTFKNKKEAGWGGILGGIGLGVLLFLINIGMLSDMPGIQGVDLPTLYLANEISPILGTILSIVLLGMVYNTAVGMLYAFTARFVPAETKAFKGSVVVVGILAFLASFVGFITLVGKVYPVTGYLGFVVIIAVIVSWFRRKKTVGIANEEMVKS